MSIDVKIRPGLATDNKPHMVPNGSKLVSDEKMEAIVLAAVTGLIAVGSPILGLLSSAVDQSLPLTSRYSLPSTRTTPTLAFAKQRVGKAMGSRALVADSKETMGLLLPLTKLAMLLIILWQGWETLAEAREPADHED